MIKNILQVILYILFLISGCLIGEFWNSPIHIDDQISIEINPIDIITMIVTIFLALYLAEVVEKRKQDDRVEKDLLINRIENIEHELSQSSKILNSKLILYDTLVANNKNVFIALQFVKDFIQSSSYSDVLIHVRKLSELFIDFHKNSTKIDGVEAKVEKNILNFSTNKSKELKKQITHINKCLFDLIIEVNKK